MERTIHPGQPPVLTRVSVGQAPAIRQAPHHHAVTRSAHNSPAAWCVAPRRLALWVLALSTILIASPAPAETMVMLDGSKRKVEVTGIDAQGRVQLKKGDAESLQGLRRIEREVKPTTPADDAARIYLDDGSLIYADRLKIDAGRITFDWAGGGGQVLPMRPVVGVLLNPGKPGGEAEDQADQANGDRLDPLFTGALEARQAEADTLIVRTDDGKLVTIEGVLEALGAEQATFVYKDEARTVSREKIYGLTLARAAAQPDLTGRVEAHMADGSRIWGKAVGLDDKSLTLARPSGVELDLPWAAVRRLTVRSDRMAFLSDLRPIRISTDAIHTNPAWTPRMDALVMSSADDPEPIQLGGTTFDKGLGVRSMTRLVYDIGGQFKHFVATIGFDDYWDKGLGEGEFRVIGDGQVLLARKMTAKNKPQTIRVDVSGVQELALEIDPLGDDTGDSAAWADARLIREDP